MELHVLGDGGVVLLLLVGNGSTLHHGGSRVEGHLDARLASPVAALELGHVGVDELGSMVSLSGGKTVHD